MAVINDTLEVTTGILLQEAGVQMLVVNVINTVNFISYACAILELTMGIFIVYSMCKKQRNLLTSFFAIYACGCFVDFVHSVASYVQEEYGRGVIYTAYPNPELMYYMYAITNVVEWYFTNFRPLWNTILSLNRFTAIRFWHTHPKIWNFRNTIIAVAILLANPCVVGFDIFISPTCYIDTYDEACQTFSLLEWLIRLSWSITHVVLALVMSLWTVFATLRLSAIDKEHNIKGIEHKLVKQTVVTTTCGFVQIIFLILSEATKPDRRQDVKHALIYIGFCLLEQIFGCIYQYSSLFILLIMCPSVRKGFLKFLKIDLFFTRVIKIQAVGDWLEEEDSDD